MTQPNIFSRQFRKTAERKQWLSQLQMTDEQLEGWFIMFERNVSMLIQVIHKLAKKE
jgi:hypothetical protein